MIGIYWDHMSLMSLLSLGVTPLRISFNAAISSSEKSARWQEALDVALLAAQLHVQANVWRLILHDRDSFKCMSASDEGAQGVGCHVHHDPGVKKDRL